MSDIIIENYSEKAIAVFGDTKPIKDQLSGLNGKFNASLRGNGDEKRAGWIFPKTKKDEVQRLIDDYKNNPQVSAPHVFDSGKKRTTTQSSGDFIFTKEMYLALLTRIEKQETELILCKKIIDKFTNNGSFNFAVDVKKPTNTLLTTSVTKKVVPLASLTKKQVSSDEEDEPSEPSDESDDETELKKPMKNLLNFRK